MPDESQRDELQRVLQLLPGEWQRRYRLAHVGWCVTTLSLAR